MAMMLGGRLVAQDSQDWNENAEGWDELHHRKVVLAGSAQLALLSSGFAIGVASFTNFNMICVGRSAKRVKARYWEVTGEFKGISTAKPYKRVLRTFPDKSRGTVSRVEAGVPYLQEVELNENLVGVSVHYVGHAAPPMNWVGYNAAPIAGGVPVPAPHWTGLRNPLEVIPSGWVLDGIEAEELPGSKKCLIRMDYVYYQRYKPGSQTN